MITQRKFHDDVRARHITVDHNLCYSCGACVAVCPPDSIFLDNSYLAIDDDTCTRCERCVRMCPVHALSIIHYADEL